MAEGQPKTAVDFIPTEAFSETGRMELAEHHQEPTVYRFFQESDVQYTDNNNNVPKDEKSRAPLVHPDFVLGEPAPTVPAQPADYRDAAMAFAAGVGAVVLIYLLYRQWTSTSSSGAIGTSPSI